MSTRRVLAYLCLIGSALAVWGCKEPNKWDPNDPNVARTDAQGSSYGSTGGKGGTGGGAQPGTGGVAGVSGSSGSGIDAPVGGSGGEPDADGDMGTTACNAGATRC